MYDMLQTIHWALGSDDGPWDPVITDIYEEEDGRVVVTKRHEDRDRGVAIIIDPLTQEWSLHQTAFNEGIGEYEPIGEPRKSGAGFVLRWCRRCGNFMGTVRTREEKRELDDKEPRCERCQVPLEVAVIVPDAGEAEFDDYEEDDNDA